MTRLTLSRSNMVRIQGEKSSSLDLARGRITMIVSLFILFYVVMAAGLFDATVIRGYFRVSDAIRVEKTSAIHEKPVVAVKNGHKRADIVDRNGVLLATSLKTASLIADQKEIIDPVVAAKALASIFPDMRYGDLLKKLQGEKRFVWVRRNLTPNEQQKILEIGDPGLSFKFDYRRIYPQGRLTSHFVGYTDVDGKGLGGVERSFNKVLASQDDPLALTLDVRLQHALRREIRSAIKEFTAKAGAGLIMDVNTGEVLAAVSYPDFDPHLPDDPKKPTMFNRVTLGTYELGSTFKIFTTAALFEKTNTGMAQTFDATKPLKRDSHTINDYHPMHRALTVPETFMHSSNIATALMAERMGTAALKESYRDLGLMTKIKFDLDEVGAPILPSPWKEINTLTASYGHGIAVTPLQMVSAVSSVINGGMLVHPTLVKDEDRETPLRDRVRVISKQTSLKMRQLLRLVVAEGTASKAEVAGYDVGGKTGTADKNFNGRYDHTKKISSFVGVFPMHEPKYAVFIMVDEPNGTKKTYGYATAGWVAAPAVARVIEGMAPLLNIAPGKPGTPDLAESLKQYVALETKE